MNVLHFANTSTQWLKNMATPFLNLQIFALNATRFSTLMYGKKVKVKVKVKQYRYRPGVAQRVPES
jgi:hypothetical protein